MLTDLVIKNFAIIDTLHLTFGPGLNILSGETGAGKSIIIGALGLVLGGRGSSEIIRTGEEEAVVEALFDLSGTPGIESRLAEAGVDADGELLVKRVVSRSGKNRVYLNGSMATTAILSACSRLLLNIYGQHESQTLLRSGNHLALLDGFGELTPLTSNFSKLFTEYGKINAELKRLEADDREAERRMDLLAYQSREIGEAGLKQGEEEALHREKEFLANAGKLSRNSQSAFDILYGGECSVLGLLNQARGNVAEIAAVDPSLALMLENVAGLCIQVEDAALSLRDYSARIESDPHRLQDVDDRLDLINRLKKKYGSTVDDILSFKDEIDTELVRLDNREESREALKKELVALEKNMLGQAAEITRKRRETAGKLKTAMEKELQDLAMKNAAFDVFFEPLPEPGTSGMERVEFLFSPNPGEEPKPLSKVASGGELSRIMLALKQLHPESDVPTLIFDEVDSGIGGATSAIVGKKLKSVASRQQVLCITHLPQVAAFADRHFMVEKKVEGKRTMTAVTALEGHERVAEMARMLGGIKLSDKSLDHARELIEEAQSAV